MPGFNERLDTVSNQNYVEGYVASEDLLRVNHAFNEIWRARELRENVQPVNNGHVALGFWFAGPMGMANPVLWKAASNAIKTWRADATEQRAMRMLNDES